MREFFLKLAGTVASVLIALVLIAACITFFEALGAIPAMQTEALPPAEPARFPAFTA